MLIALNLQFFLITLNDGKKHNKLHKKFMKNKRNLKQDTVTENPEITEVTEATEITEYDNEEDTTSTVTHFLPDITPSLTRRTTTTITTTPEPLTNFTDAKSVEAEIREALDDFERSMIENLDDFLIDTRERADTETSRIFELLEKDEIYNLFEGKCMNDQLTTFDQFETSLDAFVKIHMEHEFEGFEDFVQKSFKKFNNPFQDYVRANLETPLTTALRYNKVEKGKSIYCANTFVPEIVDFIENGYGDILDCYVIDLYYNETDVYQDIITSLYRETASYLTTCTNAACFKRVKFKFLKIKSL